MTKWGGETSPTFPHTEIAPVARRARIDSVMKEVKGLQEGWLLNTLGGGRELSYCSPLKKPLKCLKYANTFTRFFIQDKTSGGSESSEGEARVSQLSKCS